MSFYTSLTGLNAATAMLGVTANNISNVGTTGFKRSRADFGDIFATSPLQKSSSTVGQGVSLKQVSQEFGQGNISFSANALDLAVTGDGFFPIRSADGLSELFTRNGSFLLNEQFNVVNSSGQRLMAATVDSTGSANVNERVVLTIPQKTSGEAKQTSLVSLGLNFPADATVITETFNRSNPATYNKSTAFTVYDKGGNGYLATIYYVKTANANQSSPTNKWQTYVYVGDDAVAASLVQSTNANGEKMYTNQYGQIKPFSQVKDELTTNKTQLFSLDEMTDKRVSTAAKVNGTAVTPDWSTGINFFANRDTYTAANLTNMFSIDIDGTKNPVAIDLSHLRSINATMTGAQIANEVTNIMNRKFGDETYFDFTKEADRTFKISSSRYTAGGAGSSTSPFAISFAASDLPTTTPATTLSTVSISQAVAIMQTKLDAAATGYAAAAATAATAATAYTAAVAAAAAAPTDAAKATTVTTTLAAYNTANSAAAALRLTVAYDYANQAFKFTDSSNVVSLTSGSATNNDLLGLTQTATTLDSTTGLYGVKVLPNTTTALRVAAEQRFGMKMTYDSINKVFAIESGTTGDNSSVAVSGVTATGLSLLGLTNSSVTTSATALRGVASTPAVARGTTPTTNLTSKFAVDNTNNKFVVTVDGIKGTVVLPINANHSITTFMADLEKGINSLGGLGADGTTPVTVNGVKVSYDAVKNNFVFTTGTTGTESFIKISGDPSWGLETVEAGRGNTSNWIKPTQHKDIVNGTAQAKYIDGAGLETTNGDGFTTLPAWSPIFLDKGELTFDTGGKLISPVKGTQLETVYLAGGKGALTININYAASTQFSSPFAVLSQSQDGAPEGDLVGVTIGNDGLVSASFSNGTQKSLAKILLVNFSSPVGLRQIGDSSFLSSAASGKPILGTAGSAGFGTLRAGATERANVDLTQELVDLITAQRNFQANAKAIETSSTMTSAIINLRS
jgi:flagellar hook-basal body protein